MGDARAAERVLAAGAHAFYALDTSLRLFEDTVAMLLSVEREGSGGHAE
jgi:hypothetical protein